MLEDHARERGCRYGVYSIVRMVYSSATVRGATKSPDLPLAVKATQYVSASPSSAGSACTSLQEVTSCSVVSPSTMTVSSPTTTGVSAFVEAVSASAPIFSSGSCSVNTKESASASPSASPVHVNTTVLSSPLIKV